MLNELQKRQTEVSQGIGNVQSMQAGANLNQAVLASLVQQELSPRAEKSVQEEEVSLVDDTDHVL